MTYKKALEPSSPSKSKNSLHYLLNFTWLIVEFHNRQHTTLSNRYIFTIGALLIWNEKKLLNNSSWDFEHVLDTMDDYWVGPDENFCPESTPTRWRCYHFSKKWSKSKFDATLSIKKPFVTPKFCGRNFSQMHHFEDMNFLSPLDFLYLL